MFEPVDIHEKLLRERRKEVKSQDIIGWAYSILQADNNQEKAILQRLSKSPIEREINNFDIDVVDRDAIFHISQIQKICVDYRLRFLDTKYFKSQYPKEVVEKIQNIEKAHNTVLDGFKIIAPSKLFTLDKADDPLLFAPMGNGYYYLIHKWGKDLHPLRKIKFWGIKNVENLGISVLAISFLLTLLTKDIFYGDNSSFGHVFMLFLFYLKGVLGMIFFYGAASGKNFSAYSWQSRYDKIT